jgi:hypothetical protein
MMSNPLIEKYNELYGKKEEPKKVEHEIDSSTVAAVDEYLKYTKPYLSSPNIPLTTSPTVVNPNTLIGPSPKSSVNANNLFLEIAEKIKNGTVQVTNVCFQVDAVGTFSCGKRISFEVYDYEP